MSELRELISELVAKGLDPIDAAEIITRATLLGAAQAGGKTARQTRNARYYQKSKASEKRLKRLNSDADPERLKTSEKRLNSDAQPHARVDDNLPSEKLSGQEGKKENKNSSSAEKPPVEVALEAYSAMAKATGLADVRVFSDARRRSLAAILAKHGLPTWLEAVQRVGASDFCHGIGGRDGWKADLDFMLQPKSFGRILEGHYANRATGHRATAPPTMLADVTAERIRQRSYANGHSDHHDGPEIDGSLERGTGKQSPPALFFTSD